MPLMTGFGLWTSLTLRQFWKHKETLMQFAQTTMATEITILFRKSKCTILYAVLAPGELCFIWGWRNH